MIQVCLRGQWPNLPNVWLSESRCLSYRAITVAAVLAVLLERPVKISPFFFLETLSSTSYLSLIAGPLLPERYVGANLRIVGENSTAQDRTEGRLVFAPTADTASPPVLAPPVHHDAAALTATIESITMLFNLATNQLRK